MVGLLFLAGILGCSRSQGIFFTDTVLEAREPSDTSEIPSVLLRAGEGTVLRILQTISGDWKITDTSVERVLLVGLKRFTVGVPIDIDTPDVTLWFRGREPVLRDRGGLVATRGTGSVTILASSEDAIDVEVDVRLEATSLIVRTATTEVAIAGRLHLVRGDPSDDVMEARGGLPDDAGVDARIW